MGSSPTLPAVDAPAERSVMKTAYCVLIALGAAAAALIFGVLFDRFSEETLVQICAVWIGPIVFGVHGLAAEAALSRVRRGEAESVPAIARLWIRSSGPPISLARALSMFCFPFLVPGPRSSIYYAMLSSLFWVGLMVFFFVAIFPEL